MLGTIALIHRPMSEIKPRLNRLQRLIRPIRMGCKGLFVLNNKTLPVSSVADPVLVLPDPRIRGSGFG